MRVGAAHLCGLAETRGEPKRRRCRECFHYDGTALPDNPAQSSGGGRGVGRGDHGSEFFEFAVGVVFEGAGTSGGRRRALGDGRRLLWDDSAFAFQVTNLRCATVAKQRAPACSEQCFGGRSAPAPVGAGVCACARVCACVFSFAAWLKGGVAPHRGVGAQKVRCVGATLPAAAAAAARGGKLERQRPLGRPREEPCGHGRL